MRIAGYDVEERIAVGGMAEIFRATRAGPGGFAKQVVIKRLLPDLGRQPGYVDMFLEEARLAATLSCRNIVQVFDFGEEDGAHFMVMEYVDGCDLATMLRAHGPLSPEVTGVIANDLCEALSYLHEATDNEIVHRDVNPANILVSTRGEVKLADLGIAKTRARALRTRDGVIKGKLAYLSPEQARGDQLDARSDIYTLGLCLFEALTGEHYLRAADDVELFRMALDPPSRPLRIAPAIDEVVNRALQPGPEARYPRARALRDALARWPTHARAREELGGMVERPAPSPADHTPTRAQDDRSAPISITPHTEVHDVLDTSPRRWGLLGGIALIAVAVAGVLLWPDPTTEVVEPAVPQPAVTPESTPTSRSPAPAQTSPIPSPRRTAVAPKSTPTPEPTPAPMPESEPTPEHAPADASVRLLVVDRTLQERGLLPEDIPALQLERTRLGAAGEVPLDEVEALLTNVRAVVIDRAFVDAKLQRLNRRMEARKLPADVQNRVLRHTRRALSHSVRGEYDAANGELNRVAELVP